MIEHNPLVYDNEHGSDSTKDDFYGAYQHYRDLRELAQLSPRTSETSELPRSLAEDLQETRNEIARIVLGIYKNSDSLEDFDHQLQEVVSYSGQVSLENLEEYVVSAYMYPSFQFDNSPSSPIEAIYATCENLRVASEFLTVGKEHADSILLSGANAWGAFSAVRGKIQSALVKMGVEQRDLTEISDIDFLVTAQTIDDLAFVIIDYIQAGLIDPSEQQRFNTFRELFAQREVSVLSVRAHYRDIEESIHFVLNQTITDIGDSNEEKTADGICYVKTLRPNLPNNLLRHGGYPTVDLFGQHHITFDPTPTPVHEKDSNKQIGYVSRIPTGGFIETSNQSSYFIGALSFYLLIAPALLFDRTGQMEAVMQRLRDRIKLATNGKLPTYIPRQERMDPKILTRIKEAFL